MDFVIVLFSVLILTFSSKDDPHLKHTRWIIAMVAIFMSGFMFYKSMEAHVKLAKSSASMYTIGTHTEVIDFSHTGFKYEPDEKSFFYTGSK